MILMCINNYTVEELVNHIQSYLGNRYKINICDIPTEYIKTDTKCIEIVKGDEIYTEWLYKDFNINKLRNDAERFMIIDRDMDAITSGEFRDIGQRIISALDNIKE